MRNIDLSQLDLTDVVIPNDLPTARREIIAPILSRAAELEYGNQDQFALRLGLEEALSNAYRHGNRCDPQRTIRARWRVEPEFIVVCVADQGDGFNPNAVPDPRTPENREKPCGRGVMLMRAYMSQIAFNEDGNEVCMIKTRKGSKPVSMIL